MSRIAKLLVLILSPLLLAARGLNAFFGRDPLRLRPVERDSYWIERGAPASPASYFSEASETEGRNHGGFGRIAAGALQAAAKLFAPRRDRAEGEFKSAMDKEQGIPDEIYTLW